MAAEIRIISDDVTLVGWPSWPIPPISLQAGKTTFDLATTIPAGLPAGTYGTDKPLPSGWAITTAGKVSYAGTVSSSVQGVVFTYTIPTA